jgi:SAM-dependent methyltransferase
MEQVNCNFCNSSDNKLICEQTDLIYNTTEEIFKIVECNECGLNFTNPRPNEQEIVKYYKSDYQFHKKNSKLNILIKKIAKMIVNSNLAYIFSLIPLVNEKLKFFVQKKIKNPLVIKKNDFFLDIGAGSVDTSYIWDFDGSLKNYNKKTNNVYAIEPGLKSLELIKRQKIHGYKCIDELPKDLKFDFIRMNWSLEHAHNPKAYFEFFKNRIKPGGKILICIPNYDGLIYKIDKSQVEVPIHLYHFKKNDIQNYSKLFDFEVENFETFSLASMFYAVSKYNKKFQQFGKMSLIDLKNFQNTLNLLDQYELGGDMIFVLKKINK